jgi:MFS transporter, DHA1 family, inner membrane transport protein
MNRQEKQILALLAALNFTHILDFMIMMPLGNYLIPFFNINTSQFTILVSSYALSAGTSSFLSAFFVNNFDRKKVLMMAYTGFLLGTFACGFAQSYNMLLMARIVAGIFGGMLGAQVISIVSDLFPFERRGQAMGAVMAAFAIASTIGVPIALYLANAFSWHAPFILVAAVGSLIVPIIYYVLPSMTGHLNAITETHAKDVIKNVINDKKQLLALLFSGLMMMGHFMIIPFINPFLEFNKGYSKSQTPLVYLFGGICAFLASNILGTLSDKYGKWKVYSICIFVSIPLVLTITNLPTMPITFVLILFCLWFTAATGRGVTAQAMVSNVVDPKYRGSFQSFNSFMQQLGTGLASIIAGLVVVKDVDGKLLHYPYLGILSIIALLSTLWIGNLIFGNKQTIQSY